MAAGEAGRRGGLASALLHGALDGGGTVSLMTDAQGKTFSTALLRLRLPLPPEIAVLLDPATEVES